jgi:pSer/pThr/pTyr-binding forkhead associated (FHA) protein
MAHLLIRNTVLSDRRLPLPGKVLVVGRSLDADIPIPHKSVSRRHALLEAREDGYVISDLGSSNGTFVEELRVYPAEKTMLPLGGSFRVGEVRVVLAPDELIGESAVPAASAPRAAAAVRDGLTLGPPPGAPRAAPGRGKPSSAARGKPSPALRARAEKRRVKQAATRWAMAAVTLVLLSLAAFFAYRIAENRAEKRPALLEGGAGANPDAAAGQEEPERKKPQVAPIIIEKR